MYLRERTQVEKDVLKKVRKLGSSSTSTLEKELPYISADEIHTSLSKLFNKGYIGRLGQILHCGRIVGVFAVKEDIKKIG